MPASPGTNCARLFGWLLGVSSGRAVEGFGTFVGRVTPAKVRNPDLPATQYFDGEVVVQLLIARLPFTLAIIVMLKSILVILVSVMFVLSSRD